MTNRHERRKTAKLHRIGLRALRLRCTGCDRVGRPMTQEHFFPKWLIEYAEVHREGISWLGKDDVSADSATVPLCDECNNLFGTLIEGPVSKLFRTLDADQPISDYDAELLVRWMWKFEGFQWAIYARPEEAYSHKYRLRDRVTQPEPFAEIREHMVLALATLRANDPGFEDWPLGIDTPPGEDAITMSGVFRRVAIITSLTQFADEIPDTFGKYLFGKPPPDRHVPVFSPPCSFPFAKGAIELTQSTATRLSVLHTQFGREARQSSTGNSNPIIPVRYRVELPPT
jgi:hypothetical protein